MLKIAIYDRYLSTAGGGERYSCKMAEILSAQSGYEVDLVTDLHADIGEVARWLNLDLSNVNLKVFPYISDDYTKKLTAGYDLFINTTYLSALPAYGAKNIYLCYFPTPFDVDFKFIHRFLLIFFRLPAIWLFRLAGKMTGGFKSINIEEGLYEPKRFMLRRGSWTSGRAILKIQGDDMLALGIKNPPNSPVDTMDISIIISRDGHRIHEYRTALKRGQRQKIRIPFASISGEDSGKKEYTVEINSNTFSPAEDGSGSRDTRKLGAVIYDETEVNPAKKLILKILGFIPLFLITYPRHYKFLDTYQKIISISEYSSFWIKRFWDKDSTILFPPVDTESFRSGGNNKKEKAILSVGRFFPEHHNKKQYELAATFIKMIEEYPVDMKGYTLYLAGGVSGTREHLEYVERIKKLSAGYPIEVLPNVSFKELTGLFKKSSIFWHASGLGEDENAHPEKFEHFGITTAEAMSAGCIPVVINKGGQKEIIEDGVDGFFFSDLRELSDQTLKIIRDEADSGKIRENAVRNCQKFSNSSFKKELLSIIEEVINT
ncbi:MAG: glycosyltransferase [Actinobacteria bacterium]|nr:glycosyltransferase [Actinomycetota bacterium]